jgi:hypothetical protein
MSENDELDEPQMMFAAIAIARIASDVSDRLQ